MNNDLIGKKIRVNPNCFTSVAGHSEGDIGLVTRVDDDGYAWAFMERTKKTALVGMECRHFELVKESEPISVADEAFYEAELDKANREIERLTVFASQVKKTLEGIGIPHFMISGEEPLKSLSGLLAAAKGGA